MWNYYVFPETHEFLSWSDSVPPYSQTAAEGIPNEAYVHTIQNEVRFLPTTLPVLYFAQFIGTNQRINVLLRERQ